MAFTTVITNEEALHHIAYTLSQFLMPNMTVLLDGELGAGKTTFTKSVAKGLGIEDIVKSPTYAFVKSYHSGRIPLFHLDVYRLEETGHEGLGLEDYFEMDGICVVEWSQFIQDILPEHYLLIQIERVMNEPTSRKLTFIGNHQTYDKIIKSVENAL